MVCEAAPTPHPNAVASWEETPIVYSIQPLTKEDAARKTVGDGSQGRIYDAGDSNCAWEIAEKGICTVYSFMPGMELEADIIAFVKAKVPSMPIPEVIFTWIEEDWQRTFLIERRVAGQMLVDAWPAMSLEQRLEIAKVWTNYNLRR